MNLTMIPEKEEENMKKADDGSFDGGDWLHSLKLGTNLGRRESFGYRQTGRRGSDRGRFS